MRPSNRDIWVDRIILCGCEGSECLARRWLCVVGEALWLRVVLDKYNQRDELRFGNGC